MTSIQANQWLVRNAALMSILDLDLAVVLLLERTSRKPSLSMLLKTCSRFLVDWPTASSWLFRSFCWSRTALKSWTTPLKWNLIRFFKPVYIDLLWRLKLCERFLPSLLFRHYLLYYFWISLLHRLRYFRNLTIVIIKVFEDILKKTTEMF